MQDNTRKPCVIYVDDEKRNTSLVELTLPDDWDIHVFNNAADALQALPEIDPDVIISDQKMPQMTGLQFLEFCTRMHPKAVRVVVTGQTDDRIVIELIQKAKLYDYIRKPWDGEDFVERISKALEFSMERSEKLGLVNKLEQVNKMLREQQAELLSASDRESKLRALYEGWIQYPLATALKGGSIQFPFNANICCIVFDIIESSRISEVEINGRNARTCIMHLFKEEVIRNGGINESDAGDASYSHFGAFGFVEDPCLAAYHTAQAFRGKLRRFCQSNGIEAECGIAIHYARGVTVDKFTVNVQTPDGQSFLEHALASQSPGIDLVHRLEAKTHDLPGSNILVTQDFISRLSTDLDRFKKLPAPVLFRGQKEEVELYLLSSDLMTDDDFDKFVRDLQGDLVTQSDKVS